MKSSDLVNRFYKMEVDCNLFEIKDDYGICVWDIIRYKVFAAIQWETKKNNRTTPKKQRRRYINAINSLLSSLYVILFVKRKYYFFLVSRNRYELSDSFFDQNAYDTLSLFDKKECLLNENYDVDNRLVYDGYPLFRNSSVLVSFFKKNQDEYNFSSIIRIIKEYFPNFDLDFGSLNKEYKRFWEEYRYYRFLFKRTKTEIVFITQSGLRKGLFYAAKSLKIPTIEFNHGIVFNGHMSYSYPQGINCTNYNADIIFSLSNFWFKDMYLPNTKVVPVGNSYFYPRIDERPSVVDVHSLLVISANLTGEQLKDFLIESMLCDNTLKSIKIFFKLHPNQFNELEKYQSYFKDYENVMVVTNQHSVPEYMKICAAMLTIQSTAAYEALQLGRKVIIYKGDGYEVMKVIIGSPNTFFVNTPQGLINAVNEKLIPCEYEYFEKYNSTMARKVIQAVTK